MTLPVELVSTGSELLSGRTLNRHAQTLGERIRALGLSLVRDTTVRDDSPAIREAVQSALSRVDVVFVSGGLGPTSDDVTREALAELLGRKIVLDQVSLDVMQRRYDRIGRRMTEQSKRQALIVEGGEALSNSVGLAPGERLEFGGKVLFVLPGPPDEFHAVLEDHIVPWLKQRYASVAPAAEKIFLTCGIAEAEVARRFEEAGLAPAGIEIGYCAAPGRVEVRLTSAQGDEKAVEAAGTEARKLIGEFVFAEDRRLMEEVVGQLLRDQGATVAVAESCSGGLLGHRLTALSGSSEYFIGGLVAYSNDVKVQQLGVKPETLKAFGAVSEETAREMAVGVRERFGVDFGVSVTGIAGPTGGSVEKPVGTVFVGVADRSHAWVRRFLFPGNRVRIKEWSTQMALDLLRRRLANLLPKEGDGGGRGP